MSGLLDWAREPVVEPPKLLARWQGEALIHPPMLGVAAHAATTTPDGGRLIYALSYDGSVVIEQWSR